MIVTRFAPSPTGYLHLGHAFAAITAYEAARNARGCFLLRMEDIDVTRARPEFETAIMEDLHWLGLDWPSPVLRQSERFAAYGDALERLQGADLVYPCFCTRSEIAAEIARASQAPQGPEGALYPGLCRNLSAAKRARRLNSGTPHALRLDAAKAKQRAGPLRFEEHGCGPDGEHGTIEVNPLLFGDIVVARKDLPASYHLAVVVDDAYQSVTLVTRGNDLFAATHVQRLLQALLALPAPAYAHHRLVLDEHGRKLSKRDKATGLRQLREKGLGVMDVRRLLKADATPANAER
jgi:glutamyl-Q tRNA(Asp) synthetase